MKIVWTGLLLEDIGSPEDNGMARIGDFVIDRPVPNLWPNIISWDDDSEHTDFKKIVGKRVKITLEVIDED